MKGQQYVAKEPLIRISPPRAAGSIHRAPGLTAWAQSPSTRKTSGMNSPCGLWRVSPPHGLLVTHSDHRINAQGATHREVTSE